MSKFLRSIWLFVISPTRLAIECVKNGKLPYGKIIRVWNWIFRSLMIVFVVGLWFAKTGAIVWSLHFHLGMIVLWLLPFSRVNELFIAYYRDAFQRFTTTQSGTKFTHADRLRMLVWSYLEVTIQFGILYFCVPWFHFSKDFCSIFEAIYFSAVTITTAGYGDIIPKGQFSQFASVYELSVGFVLVIFALGSYLATSSSSLESD